MRCVLGYALPHAGVSPRQLLGCVVRPAIATLAMTNMLWQLGMAWTPSSTADAFGVSMDAAARSVVGALCYGTVLLAVWLGAGCPDGAGRFTLTTARRFWLRLRRVARCLGERRINPGAGEMPAAQELECAPGSGQIGVGESTRLEATKQPRPLAGILHLAATTQSATTAIPTFATTSPIQAIAEMSPSRARGSITPILVPLRK